MGEILAVSAPTDNLLTAYHNCLNSDRKTVVKSIGHRPLSSRFAHWFSYPRDSIYNQGRGWKTAHRKLYLSPLAIWERHQKPGELIGLRFGKETNYFLVDIDAGSPYHNEDGLRAVKGALEDMGIPETVLIRSSQSGGWHLYGFLPDKVGSFALATALTVALADAGLVAKGGQLEIFPNLKSYTTEGFSLYNGHRLPLQPNQGSYLLDDDLAIYSDSLEHFLDRADRAADAVDWEALTSYLAEAKGRMRKLRFLATNKSIESNKALEWRKSLESRIEEGFTAFGQTNDLVRDVIRYLVVFGGAEGQDLREKAHALITSMPGYRAYCRHRGHIQRRINDWAKATESKGYYVAYRNFPDRLGPVAAPKPKGLTNDEKVADAMGRVADAVAELMANGLLPEKVGARRKAVAKLAHCSESTLAKPEYLPLWHPSKLVRNDRASLHTARDIEVEENLDHTPYMKCGTDRKEKHDQNYGFTARGVVADKVPTPESLTMTKFASKPLETCTTEKPTGPEPLPKTGLRLIQGGRADVTKTADATVQTEAEKPEPIRVGVTVKAPRLYPREVFTVVEVYGRQARLEGLYGFEWQALSDLEVAHGT